jgi:ribosome-binding ATPase YchF (GTP1/OBG family)
VALTLGIVGLPNVGKSTLFNALTKNDVLAANYPFATIEPNTGVVGVPDARLAHLAQIFNSAEVIPATVTFVDIAGIVKGASEGAGLGNKFLANIRESNAICQVLRAFHDGFDSEPLRELSLLTAKPYVYVINCDEQQLTDDEFKSRMRELVAPAEAVFLDAKVEAELVELPADEALELLQSVGQEESGLDALARVGFATLGLQTYLTAGPKEARAWTIPRDATAPEAAGVIHTDFQKGFIKAEVVSYDELLDAGSMAEAKSRGKVRMEGKDYVMADGDVVEFRFNV